MVDVSAEASGGLDVSTADGKARAAALAAAPAERTPTSLVAYSSAGAVLVVGPEPYALEQASSLPDSLSRTVLATEPGAAASTLPAGVRVVRAPLVRLEGYLGNFQATVSLEDKEVNLAEALGMERAGFDMVLDLARTPHLRPDIPPPGYYAPGRDADALYRALEAIPGMVGEFEKPRYFNYDPAICAHGRRGVAGCTRCLDACPTDAIRSLGEQVEVDPYLCQGGGTCATACPTGAMTYAYPPVDGVLDGLRHMFRAYRENGGDAPRLLVHDTEAGRDWMARHGGALAGNVIPLEVEEVGSLGMDAWLTALAYGAREVSLLTAPGAPGSVVQEVDRQARYTAALLQALGVDGERVSRLEADDEGRALARLNAPPASAVGEPAGFAAPDEKRTTLRLALEHLAAQREGLPATATLPEGAPFGQVLVDTGRCTLCMSCVSVCPAQALADGGEKPALHFTEWNCVQCGMCESACPEDAVTLQARIILDPELRRGTRVLHEEEPLCCVVCGKPFATRSVMERMREKLKDHWMFQDPDTLRRMEMCEECRVTEMFRQETGLLDPDKKLQS